MTEKIRQIEFVPEEPIEHGGKTYDKLVLKRLKAKHLVASDAVQGASAKAMAMYAAMADVPLAVIEELELEDFNRLATEALPLMGKSAQAAAEAQLRDATADLMEGQVAGSA